MIKNLYYKVLELLTRGKGKQVKISGIEINLPVRYHKYYEIDYELKSITQMKKIISKGDVVIDVGAQLGLMSKLFSDCVESYGKVYAFEPTPVTFKLLENTISINNLNNVVPVQKAVADKSGITVFNISNTDASAANSLAKGGIQGNDIPIEVELVSIDDFSKTKNIAKIDFIKIDAEGAELAVLKGALNVIKRDKPKILLALHPDMIINFGDTLSDIYDFCTELNYNLFYETKLINKNVFVDRRDLFDVFLINESNA